MAYIGNFPAEKFTTFSKQTFTPDGSTTSFTLDFSVANENDLELFVNNVRQEPGSGKAYTATGLTLTMSSAPGASDDMYAIFQGKAQQTVLPGSQTVTGSMLTPDIAVSTTGNITTTGDLTVDTNTLYVDSTNNYVGIGTATPAVALDVVGAITATGNITGTLSTAAQPSITSVGTLTSFTSTGIDDNATSTAITIDSSERVLINQTSTISGGGVTASLQLSGTNFNNSSVFFSNFGNDSDPSILAFNKSRSGVIGTTGTIVQNGDVVGNINWNADDGTNLGSNLARISGQIDGVPGVDDTPGRLVFYTTADGAASVTERMRIDSSGNVGIGTSSPSYKLHVVGDGLFVDATSLEFDVSDTNGPVISQASSSADTLFIKSFGNIELNADSNNNSVANIIFKEGTSETMRINSFGDLQIGTTSRTGYDQTSGLGSFTFSQDIGSARGSLILTNNADHGWSLMYANKFNYSSGDDQRYVAFYKNGGSLANIQLNVAGTQVEYNTGSDRRLKENIVDIDDGITRIKQLQPRKYNWIGTDFNAEGFIADEADGIVPEVIKGDANAVDENNNPIYQQIEYSKFVPLLTAALKEAIAKIETLETENIDIKARLETLENE